MCFSAPIIAATNKPATVQPTRTRAPIKIGCMVYSLLFSERQRNASTPVGAEASESYLQAPGYARNLLPSCSKYTP